MMLIVKENITGSLYEVREYKETDKEKSGVFFTSFGGRKFVCSYISGQDRPVDILGAERLAITIEALYYYYDAFVDYDPHPPRLCEHKIADVLRLRVDHDGKNLYEVSVHDPPPIDYGDESYEDSDLYIY